jgi:hypothetical protein
MAIDSNDVTISIGKEVTFGTPPAATAYQYHRYTGESLHAEVSSVLSEEILATRETSDIIRTGVSAAGDLNSELTLGDTTDHLLWDLITYALMTGDTYSLNTHTDTGVDAVVSTSSFDAVGIGTAFPTVGEWVVADLFADERINNKPYLITAVAADVLTVKPAPPVDDATSAGVLRAMNGVNNGTTLSTFSIFKYLAASKYLRYTGMAIDRLSFSVGMEADAVVKLVLGWIGALEDTVTTHPDVAIDPADTGSVVNSVDNVSIVLDNGAFSAIGASFELRNNLSPLLEIGTLGATGINKGDLQISGTLRLYFDQLAHVDKIHDWADADIRIGFADGNYTGFAFNFPAVKFTGVNVLARRKNDRVMADVEWQAYKDATLAYTVKASKYHTGDA